LLSRGDDEAAVFACFSRSCLYRKRGSRRDAALPFRCEAFECLKLTIRKRSLGIAASAATSSLSNKNKPKVLVMEAKRYRRANTKFFEVSKAHKKRKKLARYFFWAPRPCRS
jgi:hypothetical protein